MNRSERESGAKPGGGARIQQALCAWFDASARDLPWRRTRDPYAIWLSEVMLQQTRVDTVIPYYERFLARFPGVDALAKAELDEVLGMWSGLGYYRRARQLHLAAREVTARFGGALPSTAAALRELHGVGRYTAGAIASIAFDQPEPLVDGNVARVLARLFGVEEDVGSSAGSRELWAIAAALVPSERPGRFNQALMELGATVCLPREPRCSACPLSAECAARREGRTGELPRVAAKRAPPRVAVVAAVVRRGSRAVLAQRAEGGLFGGMWEPPMIEAATLEEARDGLRDAGVPRVVLHEAGRVKHVLTHRELDVLVTRARPRREVALSPPEGARYTKNAWVDLENDSVGISTLARKVIARAE